MEHVENKWMIYKGSNICYQQFLTNQNKPFLIFLHGFLSCQFSFRKMIPHLKQHFNIYTLDIPPFGMSDRKTSFEYSYQNMADLVIEFMNYHSIDKAHLAGHSMGGQVALRCAYGHGNRVKSLILLSPSSYLVKADRLSYLLSLFPLFPKILRRLLKRKGVFEMLRQSLSNESLITNHMLKQYKQPFLDRKIYLCMTKMIRDREGDLSPSMLRNIETKTLLFWGKQDEIIPISTGYQLLKDLPSASFISFNNAGHLLPEETPNQICEWMLYHLLKTK
ncbi:alpha/beta fold hydrolase [Aquibacillus salsiterrae]|uniref:Alpha/beta hydrolase n=1 Tax=Aquibacillus salsiterrae TaxID=2950439 RepID=A0A9X3WJ31_9BACI|nr:alpha/beta hydrolase [Aquibacillus salsiterrae]MDC3418294.1 alpha/beta hydrolase [Aquibacillus salsiterrae]